MAPISFTVGLAPQAYVLADNFGKMVAGGVADGDIDMNGSVEFAGFPCARRQLWQVIARWKLFTRPETVWVCSHEDNVAS